MEKEFGQEIRYLFRDNHIAEAMPVAYGGREGHGKSSNVACIGKEIVESNPSYWI